MPPLAEMTLWPSSNCGFSVHFIALDMGVPGHYRHGQLGLEDPQGGEAGRGGGLAPGSSLLCCRHLSDDKKIKKEEKVWS